MSERRDDEGSPAGDQRRADAAALDPAAPDANTSTPEWPKEDLPAPAALPDESTLTPAPAEDTGSLIPDQLHDAPTYVPPALGMTSGSIMPPTDPSEVSSSAWITTAPQDTDAPRGLRSRGVRIIGIAVGIVVIGAVVAGNLGFLPSDRGKVFFGTAAGKDLCSVSNPTTSVGTTDPVFFAAVLKKQLSGSEHFTLHVTKDGGRFLDQDEQGNGEPFDCFGNPQSHGVLEPGVFVFQILHNGEVLATGTLTVK